jgi:hypothetical protein
MILALLLGDVTDRLAGADSLRSKGRQDRPALRRFYISDTGSLPRSVIVVATLVTRQIMSDTDFDIYVIQDPDGYLDLPPDSERKGDLQGQLYNLHRYFWARGDHPVYVKDLNDFVLQILVQVATKMGKIKTLVIAAHGAPGVFYIGKSPINGSEKDLAALRKLAPFFAKDANVYILACRCGQSEELLWKLSRAFGGVKVHGYTDYIVTTDYGITVTLEDGTENGGKHLVCLRNGKCTQTKDPLPRRKKRDWYMPRWH